MTRLFLIIDGYNLMHASGLGRSSYGPGDLERCRNRLLKQLESSLDESAASDAVVIFDGKSTSASEAAGNTPSTMNVRFSPTDSDADTEIENLLRTHSSPRQILVVSSDHRLHKAARSRRAQCVDSEDFWQLIQSGSGTSKLSGPDRRPDRPPTEVFNPADADYTQDFLNIDIAEIKRSVRKEDR